LGFDAAAAISSSYLQYLQLKVDDDDDDNGGVCQKKLGKIKCSLQDGWKL
jgi:hypothetical protein